MTGSWWDGKWRGKRKRWKNPFQRHFVHQKSYMISPSIEPGLMLLEASADRLSYGAVWDISTAGKIAFTLHK